MRLGRLRDARHHADRWSRAPRQRAARTRVCSIAVSPSGSPRSPSVAERYPWVNRYTPVNEPLTTARFARCTATGIRTQRADGVPARDDRSMRRSSLRDAGDPRDNPDAQLVQTEDLGKTHAFGRLAYQAEFENERRWLTFDLLCWPRSRRRSAVRDTCAGRASRMRSSKPCRCRVPARHDRHQSLPDERALSRRAASSAIHRHSTAATGGIGTPMSKRFACCATACPGRSRCSRGMGALPHPTRGDGGPPRRARASNSCAGSTRYGTRRVQLREAGADIAPSRRGRHSARMTGTRSLTRRRRRLRAGPVRHSRTTRRGQRRSRDDGALACNGDGAYDHPCWTRRGGGDARDG